MNNINDYSRIWENFENDMSNCKLEFSLPIFINDVRFTEEFILNHYDVLELHIKFILKYKNNLSDNFLNKIFTKINYNEYKCLRKLKEPLRNFKHFDDIYY